MRAVIGLAAVLLLAGCAPPAPTDPGLIDDGMGVPLPMPIGPEAAPILLTAPPADIGDGAIIEGTLGVNALNCVTIDEYIVVAPAGSLADESAVSIAGYGSYALGDVVKLGGGYGDGYDVVKGNPDYLQCVPGDDVTADFVFIAPRAR